MSLWPLTIAAIGTAGLLTFGTVSLRTSLAAAFAQGEAHGRAMAEAQAGAAFAKRATALEALRRGAELAATKLEAERDGLSGKVDDLERMLLPGVDEARAGARRCLDAGLVRALNEIGRRANGFGAP